MLGSVVSDLIFSSCEWLNLFGHLDGRKGSFIINIAMVTIHFRYLPWIVKVLEVPNFFPPLVLEFLLP